MLNLSDKNWIAAVLLCFFLGGFGVHRFYVGKTGTGVTQLVLTLVGGLTALIIIGFIPLAIVGIWVLVDFIMILVGKFKDGEDRLVKN